MAEKRKLALALSIDVEEEGLFSGAYPCGTPQIHNISQLSRLVPFFDRGIKATFFCAHCVFEDKNAQKLLETMRNKYGVEIGAHLHHWNTPPLRRGQNDSTILTKAWSAKVPLEDLYAKMETLFGSAGNFLGHSVNVFRMGRWDLHNSHWQMLHDFGVRYDASIRPLHAFKFPEGPNHFDAPSDPYKINIKSADICEIPLTCVPVLDNLRLIESFQTNLHKWGALTLLPVEHPLWLMKLTTLLHAARGGKTLSLTWHSSEMMPGGSPHMKNENSVNHFLNKILAWLSWLDDNFEMEFLTISRMGRQYAIAAPICSKSADWTFVDHKRISI